ncbi:protein TolQ [Brevundimonas sp. FT23042]|uniref:protein TolQ n=1 Tax=Brevundimonas sp. FT23042 TaxID=3393749 RepID=UPI003B589504
MTIAAEHSMLNPVSIFMEADIVVQAIMVGLAIASIWSWAVIISKAISFSALNRQANAFEDAVGSGRSLEEIAAQAGPNPVHPLPRMLVIALSDWREARTRGLTSEAQGGLLMARIDRALDSLIAREGQRVENGLGVLSVVATSSPFIGLFGTVWGIMNAFGAIAGAGNTNLTTVAPAISEALFATAIGLFAAIPAYIAYNKFSIDAGKFTGRLESFADDLQAAVARRLSSGPAADSRREV